MKSKIAKILVYVVLGVVILCGALVLLFVMFGENAIRSQIQKVGSATLGVPVTMERLNLSVLQGQVGIGGLVVQNPEGYSNKNLLELNDGSVDVGIRSLMSDTVRIEDIKLDGMNLVIEQKGLTNNLKEIINAIPKTEEETKKEGKPLVIDNLERSNITVKVKLIDVPGANTVPLKLDTIKMQNLGTDDKMSMATLVSKILVAVAQGVAKQGAGVLPDQVTDAVRSGLSGVMEQGGALMKEGQKILEGGGDVLEGMKGLFEKKKE